MPPKHARSGTRNDTGRARFDLDTTDPISVPISAGGGIVKTVPANVSRPDIGATFPPTAHPYVLARTTSGSQDAGFTKWDEPSGGRAARCKP